MGVAALPVGPRSAEPLAPGVGCRPQPPRACTQLPEKLDQELLQRLGERDGSPPRMRSGRRRWVQGWR
jgi:hypothetical protein